MNSELIANKTGFKSKTTALWSGEFDKRAKDIRVMSEIYKWFGIIFEGIMIIGVICSINIKAEGSNEIIYETGFSFYMLLGGYMVFVICMFVVPIIMIGNGEKTNIYKFLSCSPVSKGEIFKSRIKIVCKMMSLRIVIFVGLELVVLLYEHSLNVKGIALAAVIPFITMIGGILYCIPPKNAGK